MNKTALTFTSYTNAYALYLGSKEIGIDLYTTEKNRTFPIPYDKVNGSDFLLFTEEASLKQAIEGRFKGSFFPQSFPLELLDDKWAIVDWLKSSPNLIQGIRQWRISEYKSVTFPCLLKSKHSWQGSTKLPRGWICRTSEELKQNLSEAERFENWDEVFFIQEWLGDKDCEVISVCGFHDYSFPARNLTAIVKRVAAHSEDLSCSAAVETIADNWGLVERNAAILDALKFTGPYEMEYLLVDGKFRLLELNPRFWMQHAIFLKHGNGLIKRYFGMDTKEDRKEPTIPHTIWVDTVHLLISLLRLRLGFLKFVFVQIKMHKSAVQLWPSLPIACVVVIKSVMNKVKRKLFRFKSKHK